MTTADSVRRGRILLVEDDHEAAIFAVHVLTTMGRFEVTHTMDPRVALDRACAERWDLVLTDLHLPAMTGLDLLAALRQAAPALPVAVVTADITPSPGLDAARRQADAFLHKPIPAAELVAVATALINGRTQQEIPFPRLSDLFRPRFPLLAGRRLLLVGCHAVAAQFGTAQKVVQYVWQHPANSGQRGRALLRMAHYQATARLLRRRGLARLGERSHIFVDLHRWGASKVLYANPPDLPEMLAWRRELRDGGLFVDVGANVGTYTIWAAELGAEVIALEPAADTFGLLRENIDLNGYQVTAIQGAAGDHCGTARFTAGLDAGNCLASDGPVETSLVTIDSLVGDRPVTGMKIDVEGFELDVLRGAARALAEQRIGLIQLEWNQASALVSGTDRQPVADLLARHGYQLFRPGPDGDLMPLTDTGFGADVFARPVRENAVITEKNSAT